MLMLLRIDLPAGATNQCAACCTTTGCRSTRARSPTRSSCRKGARRPTRPRQRRRTRAVAATAAREDEPIAGSGKKNRIGLEIAALPRRQDDAVRRLRPQRDLRAHHRRVLRDGHRSAATSSSCRASAARARRPAYFLGDVARLQLGARPHAVGRHRRAARQPQADGDRRQRRRRHRRHRHRPVRAPDAPQPADHLHHRGQRLLRPDQGAVLADRRPRLDAEERRGQRPAADRHLRAGHRARRVVRRALVLGRQEAAARRSSRRRSATAAPR